MAGPWDSDPVANGGAPWALDPVVNQSAESPASTVGVAKQIGSGLIENTAEIPFTTPQLLKQLGDYIGNKFDLPKAQPIINAPQTPTEALSAALPPPQNPTEATARNLTQYPVSALTGGRKHLVENMFGALGAGGGSYFGPQIAPSLGMTPDEGAIMGALTGGYLGSRVSGNAANAVTRGGMPNPQEVITDTQNGYDLLQRANKAILVSPEIMGIVKNDTLRMLRSSGPPQEDAKSVYSALDSLDAINGGTAADLINLRRNLTTTFHSLHPDANKKAALMALDPVNVALDKIVAPGTMAELKRLDTNWGAARTAQAVTTKVNQAVDTSEGANSGMNSGNKIIQNINAYIKSKTEPETGKIHLAPSDLAALDTARKLDLGEKITRMISGAEGGGGGRDLGVASLLGMGGALSANQAGLNATEKGDPLIAGIGLPILGLATRGIYNRAVLRAAKNAEAQILARAPYMQGVSVPRPLLSGPQIAGRSLVFAAPNLRRELEPSDAQ